MSKFDKAASASLDFKRELFEVFGVQFPNIRVQIANGVC